jgi:hypothetical protein
MNLIVRSSSISGKGLFTAEAIPAGTSILMMTGDVQPLENMMSECQRRKVSIDVPLHTGIASVCFLDPLPNYINHSCDPNAGLRGEAELVAIRDIPADHEITYDYSTNIVPAETWVMKPCRCGSSLCRGVISDISTIPEERIQFYGRSFALQDFVRRAAIESGLLKS